MIIAKEMKWSRMIKNTENKNGKEFENLQMLLILQMEDGKDI